MRKQKKRQQWKIYLILFIIITGLFYMTKDKVFRPVEIEDSILPGETESDVSSSQSSSGGVYSASKTEDSGFPTKRVAVELLSSSLNTKSKKILAEFEFTESGALQIGKYDNGVSGDLRITPGGITARDQSGITTFAIDGETGSAVFKGTVQAGTLIGGKVAVGDGDILIDGEEKRMIFYDPDTGLASIIIGNA